MIWVYNQTQINIQTQSSKRLARGVCRPRSICLIIWVSASSPCLALVGLLRLQNCGRLGTWGCSVVPNCRRIWPSSYYMYYSPRAVFKQYNSECLPTVWLYIQTQFDIQIQLDIRIVW